MLRKYSRAFMLLVVVLLLIVGTTISQACPPPPPPTPTPPPPPPVPTEKSHKSKEKEKSGPGPTATPDVPFLCAPKRALVSMGTADVADIYRLDPKMVNGALQWTWEDLKPEFNGTKLEGLNLHGTYSPDACRILFANSSGPGKSFDLYTMSPNGKNVRRVTNTPDISEEQPIWLSDWTMLFRANGVFEITDEANSPHRKLAIVGSDAAMMGLNRFVFTSSDGHLGFANVHGVPGSPYPLFLSSTMGDHAARGNGEMYFIVGGKINTIDNTGKITSRGEGTEIIWDVAGWGLLVWNDELYQVGPEGKIILIPIVDVAKKEFARDAYLWPQDAFPIWEVNILRTAK